MLCVLNGIAFFVGWIVLIIAIAMYVIPSVVVSPLFHIVLLLYIILSLALSFIAYFVWWPKSSHRIEQFVSRPVYAILAGFKGLWRWIGSVLFFFVARIIIRQLLKRKTSEQVAKITGINLTEV